MTPVHISRSTQHLCSVLVFGIALGLTPMVAPSAFANELWVPPAKQDADKRYGNWAVARLYKGKKETHFGFHLPDNMESFTRATVVLIPGSTGTMQYRLKISVARSGEQHDAYTDVQSGFRESLTKGELTEIDVSGIFPDAFLQAGETYVSLNFEAKSKGGKPQVLGLRLQYEGPMGPEGPAGSAGEDGIPGPMGPEGQEGSMGPDGPMGPMGPMGPAGSQGELGPPGPSGSGGSGGYALMSLFTGKTTVTFVDESGVKHSLDIGKGNTRMVGTHIGYDPNPLGEGATLYFNLSGMSQGFCTLTHREDDVPRPGLHFAGDHGNDASHIWGNFTTKTFLVRRVGASGTDILGASGWYAIVCF